MRPLFCLRVTRPYHIHQARQTAERLTAALGFTSTAAAYVVTSVSELAANLVFHTTRGGTLTLRGLRCQEATGVEVVAADAGPGIADVAVAMQDGFSTNGGLGSGLPGVRRLMDEFDITSEVGVGTRIVTRKWQPCRSG